MLLRISSLTLVAVLAVSASPISLSFDTPLGWNDLLNGNGIFDEEINSIQIKSNNDAIVLGQLTALLSQDRVLQNVYSNYQNMYSKDVTDTVTQDGSSRIEFFKSKLIEIAAHNLEARNGRHTWIQGVNQFTDMTNEEFDALYSIDIDSLALSLQNDSLASETLTYSFPQAPEALDWRTSNIVTSVKNQAGCSSCVMFASTGALESVNAYRKGTTSPESLSPQELVDCAVPLFTCPESTGSNPEDSFRYLKQTGVSTFESYPYNSTKPKKGICQKNSKSHVAQIAKYLNGQNLPEDELKERVATYGPVFVTIKAPPSYNGGVLTGDACGNAKANHAVLLVGYGTNDKGVDFWIIKNSYGDKWGGNTEGYLYLARNAGFACQISKSLTVSITEVV